MESREELLREIRGLHLWIKGFVKSIRRVGDHYIIGVKTNGAVHLIATKNKYRIGEKIEIYHSLDGKTMILIGESGGEHLT